LAAALDPVADDVVEVEGRQGESSYVANEGGTVSVIYTGN
jgi:hypothetical protein